MRSLQLPTREINVDDIKINEEGFKNARTNLEDLASLQDAIENQKMLSVPVVWEKYDEETGDTSLVLMAGHRRVAAWKALREKLLASGEHVDSTLTCTIFTGTLDEALGANITENIERVALSFTDKIQGIAKLANRIKDEGHRNVQERVAKLVGCSQPTVSNYMKLYANLTRESFEALRHGNISQKQAKLLAQLAPEDQLAQLEAFLGAGEDVPEERQRPKRERTFRAKREFEELRSLLAQLESDEENDMDADRRRVILDVIRWASKELDRDQLLYGLSDAEVTVEEEEIIEEAPRKRRIRIGE